MALGVNTNISSLTAQRALAAADKDLSVSMERLSTGKRINSAGDDAAGMAIANRMSSQISSLNQAVRNANDSMGMASVIDGGLQEIGDMVERMKELAVQASNSTLQNKERQFIQNEVQAIRDEITRIAQNTTFNGVAVLDGTFTGQTIQVGGEKGNSIALDVDSVAADQLGRHKLSGDRIEVQANSGSASGNITDATDGLVINGKTASVEVAVTAGSSAETVASAINAVAGQTGVEAEALTQAYLYSEFATNQAYTVAINGTATGQFNISSSNVQGGVDAINAISSTTGVTAIADGAKIKISNTTGADITVENQSTTAGLTTLRMQTIGFDGETVTGTIGQKTNITDTARLSASTTYEVSNTTTGGITSFTTTSDVTSSGVESVINTALGATTGSAATRISTSDATSIATGLYYLKNNSDGDVYQLNVATASAAGWDTARSTATIYNVGDQLHGTTVSLADEIDFATSASKLFARGSSLFGDFDIYSDTTLQTNIMDTGHATLHNTGVKGTGVEVAMTAGTTGQSTVDIMAASVRLATGTTTTLTGSLVAQNGAAAGNARDTDAQRVKLDFTADGGGEADSYADAFVTINGLDINGVAISEDIVITGDAADVTGTLLFAEVQSFTVVDNSGANEISGNDASDFMSIGFEGTSNTHTIRGAADLGAFTITEASAVARGTVTQNTAGDSNLNDTALGLGGSSTDMGTVQGALELSSDNSFSVTQQGTEVANTGNDNYFTTSNSAIDAVSTLDMSTQANAISALRTLDGAMDKLSEIRANIGAVTNRLDHTVSNLMNVAEQTAAARSSIEDADFATESANLAKAQVLTQAATAMLAQANAAPQQVLQLLQ